MTENYAEEQSLNMLNKTEQIAFKLIQSDLQFLLTVYQNASKSGLSYPVALLPYIGMIIDGCEIWNNKVNRLRTHALKFSEEEKGYYSELRQSIKLWETSFLDLHILLARKYDESELYFSNICKPIAKKMKLYDVYSKI